ncbi:MAG: hypothetical protein WC840_04955 [Candidatus Peribacteraceae bacterium]
MNINRNVDMFVPRLRLALLLFLVALLSDHLITQWGVATGNPEGNVVVLWLWRVIPGGPHFLVLLWAMLIIGLAFALTWINIHVARWLLYSAFVGHTAGFLSWTPVLHAPVQFIWNVAGYEWGLVFLLSCSALGGALLTLVQGYRASTPGNNLLVQ